MTPKAIALRRFLISVVLHEGGRLVTYKEVGEVIDHPYRSLKPFLDEVAVDCRNRDQPDLTALVVRASTGLPGQFQWRRVEGDDLDRDAWEAELLAVRRENWD